MRIPYLGKSKNSQQLIEILNISKNTGSNVILWGAAGIGKTELVKTLAYIENLKANNIDPEDLETIRNMEETDLKNKYPLTVLIGAIMEPTELQGLPALKTVTTPDGKTVTVTDNTMPAWLKQFVDNEEKGGILFLDEFNSATPATQAAMLSLLQGRMVGQYKLPDSVWVIAAANPIDIAVSGWTLPAPLANRLLHIHMEVDNNDFIEGFTDGWGYDLNPKEKQIRHKIANFLKNNQHLIQTTPETDEEAGEAWASRRSWDNAAKNMWYATSKEVEAMILEGFVGSKAAEQYYMAVGYEELPTIEQIFSGDNSWKQLETDGLYTIVLSLSNDVKTENIENTLKFFHQLIKNGNSDLVNAVFFNFKKAAQTINPNIEELEYMKIYDAMENDTKYLR